MKKKILLTFDYELFLGNKSGSVNNCLIHPTNALLEILKKHKAKAIFFIDTTYIKQLKIEASKHQKAKEDLSIILEQLHNIIQQGHYLYHHLHPHWLDALYNPIDNQWNLQDTTNFTMYNISEVRRQELFAFSDSFLTEIYKQAGSNIKPSGYRAGGLFIEPFSYIINHFRNNSIKYEFSVVPGEKKEGEKIFYDFSELSIREPYRFSENLNVPKKNGEFVEFPISKIKISGISKILNSIYYRTNLNSIDYKSFGDGTSVSSEINSNIVTKKIIDYMRFELPMSIEMLNPILTSLCLKYISNNIFIHFLSHPKLLTQASLRELDKLLIKTKNKYHVEFDHHNMIDKLH